MEGCFITTIAVAALFRSPSALALLRFSRWDGVWLVALWGHPGGAPALLPCGSSNLLWFRHLWDKLCILRIGNECAYERFSHATGHSGCTDMISTRGISQVCTCNLSRRAGSASCSAVRRTAARNRTSLTASSRVDHSV